MKCSMWVCYKIGSSQCIIDSKFGHSNSFSFGVVSLEQIQVVSFPDGADTQGHVTAFFKLKIKSFSVFRKMGFHCLFILIFAKQQLNHTAVKTQSLQSPDYFLLEFFHWTKILGTWHSIMIKIVWGREMGVSWNITVNIWSIVQQNHLILSRCLCTYTMLLFVYSHSNLTLRYENKPNTNTSYWDGAHYK